jgi:hypothetical protein
MAWVVSEQEWSDGMGWNEACFRPFIGWVLRLERLEAGEM